MDVKILFVTIVANNYNVMTLYTKLFYMLHTLILREAKKEKSNKFLYLCLKQ